MHIVTCPDVQFMYQQSEWQKYFPTNLRNACCVLGWTVIFIQLFSVFLLQPRRMRNMCEILRISFFINETIKMRLFRTMKFNWAWVGNALDCLYYLVIWVELKGYILIHFKVHANEESGGAE